MKKSLFFVPLFAALAFTSCSSDDNIDSGGADSANANGRYLAISIVSTDGSFNTRAGEGTTPDPSKGDQYDTYEDGLAEENEVKGLRIYFFGPNGSPINVKDNNTGGNYYDVPEKDITINEEETPEHGATVEKTLNAVIVVNSGEQIPSKLIAIVNPTPQLVADKTAYTIRDLRNFVNNYSNEANNNKRFVMTNSTYAESGNVVEAAQIVSDNFQKNAEDAKKHPVSIFVERNVAKVRVNSTIPDKTTLTDGVIMYPVLDKATNTQLTISRTTTTGEEPNITTKTEEVGVYVKFYGWDVTADLKYSYLLKAINLGWQLNQSGYANWNDAAHHRCYWANVCGGGTKNDQENQYYSYNNENNFKQTKFDGTEWKYCNENAEKKYNTTTFANTSILIKGELCDKDGNPLTITEIAGTRIIDDNTGTNLKMTFLEMLKVGRDAHTHYKAIKDATGKIIGYKEIDIEDITFMTATDANTTYLKANTPTSGRYYVYPCLTTAAEQEEWYTGLKQDESGKWSLDPDKKLNDASEINSHLYQMGHAKIWKSGMTYYYTDIMHHTSPNVLGVVRNHIYDISLNMVYGIGTPVYDPTENIIPEKPQKDDTYVAAEIKILSWRLVTNNVDLEWE